MDLLISEQALLEVENLQEYQWRKLGYVRVKGKLKKIAICGVIPQQEVKTNEATQQMLECFGLGLQCYERKNFELARQYFKQVLLHADVQPALLYLRRCEEYLQLSRKIGSRWR